MPTRMYEVLMVWAYRPRSLYLILLGLSAWLLMPLLLEIYWSGVELKGMFSPLKEPLSEKYINRANKLGFIMMIGCFFSAYKVYKKDRKNF